MACGPEFHPPTICNKVYQYNNKNGSTPKVEMVDWNTNPTISQHCHQHASSNVGPKIKCTDPRLTDNQLNLSDILSYF